MIFIKKLLLKPIFAIFIIFNIQKLSTYQTLALVNIINLIKQLGSTFDNNNLKINIIIMTSNIEKH